MKRLFFLVIPTLMLFASCHVRSKQETYPGGEKGWFKTPVDKSNPNNSINPKYNKDLENCNK